jgi:thiol-disulfide isomerase/thioredoxin
MQRTCVVVSLVVALASTSLAQEAPQTIVGKKALEWKATDWIQLPEGKTTLDIGDFKDKVVYLYCFQSWCPGCHKYGFPALKKVSEHFAGNDDVAFIAIQTVFEGFKANTPARLAPIAKKFDLEIPFGQSGRKGLPSPLMRAYRTRGTPWTIIIDREGTVRYGDFHLKPEQGIELVEKYLAVAGNAESQERDETRNTCVGDSITFGARLAELAHKKLEGIQ